MRCLKFTIACGVLFASALTVPASAVIYYVKPGGTGNGLSWDTAMGNPQTAIDAATATGQAAETLDIIAVAAGTYLPPGNSGDRSRAFMPKQLMEIYGGFDTNDDEFVDDPNQNFEEDLQDFLRQRDLLANPTILSGDIAGTPTDHTDDAYHVVFIKGYCTFTGGTPPSCLTPRTITETIAKMRGALDEFKIGPIKTTIPLHRRIMDSKPFVDADFDIHYIERWLKAGGE